MAFATKVQTIAKWRHEVGAQLHRIATRKRITRINHDINYASLLGLSDPLIETSGIRAAHLAVPAMKSTPRGDGNRDHNVRVSASKLINFCEISLNFFQCSVRGYIAVEIVDTSKYHPMAVIFREFAQMSA